VTWSEEGRKEQEREKAKKRPKKGTTGILYQTDSDKMMRALGREQQGQIGHARRVQMDQLIRPRQGPVTRVRKGSQGARTVQAPERGRESN
jgi:hypothetical protein